ncbi:hypothetical protein KSP40_PGU003278 [Platanthera guangdongensis]|uniref:tRNA/rRNA methyltransferase SpoU type domain-containing protein n=1 Tax=Platanthera guangdongensis TaxID=2320717 RepID=A0ABR2MD69_9ASPA
MDNKPVSRHRHRWTPPAKDSLPLYDSSSPTSAVFLLPGCCDPFNDKAIRAARGASFQLPIICGSWSHLESLTRRFPMKMMGGHPENYGESSHQISVLTAALADALSSEPLCLVLGSEGEGLSHQALQSCQLLSIPMAGMFESLNVSVAGGIFLYMLQPEGISVSLSLVFLSCCSSGESTRSPLNVLVIRVAKNNDAGRCSLVDIHGIQRKFSLIINFMSVDKRA